MLSNYKSSQLFGVDKYIFIVGIILNFFSYGILNLQFAYNFHNPYIMAAVRLIMLACGSFLFFKSIIHREIKINLAGYCLILYVLYLFVLLAFWDKPSLSSRVYGSEFGKIFQYYSLFAYSFAPLFLFYLSKDRLLFLSDRPYLVFVPSFVATLIILLFNIGDLGMMDMSVHTGISRSSIKEPIAVMAVMAIYYMIFSDNLWKKLIFGFGGAVVSGIGVYLSTSQSIILSIGFVGIIAVILSFRNLKNLFSALVLGGSFLFIALPYLFVSRSWERLEKLFYLKTFYTMSDTKYDFSRIDLISQGWELFLSSPIIGGNPYLPNGGYTHTFIIDIMMGMGCIGILLTSIILWTCFKGALKIYTRLPVTSYWLILLCTYFFIEYLTHGSITSLISLPVAILLSVSTMFTSKL